MKLAYTAQNSIEAHMIANLLIQYGLTARIDGEYLQGAIGDLPAIGVIRVMVEEADYDAAREIIQKWEAKQPTSNSAIAPNKKNGSKSAILGFLAGIAVTAIYYNRPITQGVDYDGDGTLEEKWTYVNDSAIQSDIDRNIDGKFDATYFYDFDGLLDSLSSDDDFNGTFETLISYDNGNATLQQTDTTGNGFYDLRINFKYGLAKTIEMYDPTSERLIKVQEFGDFKVEKAQADTDADGVMDTYYKYDKLGDVETKSSQPIN